MRIGIDYTPAITQHAGIGRFTRSLVDALVRIDSRNEYVLFYADPSRSGRSYVAATAPHRNVVERPIPVSDRTLTILWHRLGLPLGVDLFTGPVDVFYSPNYALAPLRRGASIVTVHDLSFLVEPQCADARLRAFLEKVVPESVGKASFVTTDSEHTRNDVICLLDVPAHRTEVVYGGVDPSFGRVTDPARLEAVRRKHRLQFPFILHVGVIEPRKNIPTLIRAYAKLRARRRLRHKLVLAGGLGWLYHDVFHEIEAQMLGDDVVLTGFVPDEELPTLYSLADAMVWPTLYEGFGLPPLEAMACGTPVVCSNRSSLPEVVGDAALTVAPTDVDGLTDAMERVLFDEGTRTDLIARGYTRPPLFTWEKAAHKLVSCFPRAHEARRIRR